MSRLNSTLQRTAELHTVAGFQQLPARARPIPTTTDQTATEPARTLFLYPEKIEYWAVVWGTIIMGATGLAIWLKIDVTQWLPRWIIDVAITIHYYEAILACLAIVVWHFYHVMFDPDVYPMNWAWIDGKVPRKLHEEEHPLEIHPQDKPDSFPPAAG